MKSIKYLFDKNWVVDFFNRKTPRYFPGRKLIGCEIKPIKIYLDYKRVVVRYNLKFLDKKGKNLRTSVIGKAAEEPKKERSILNDYLTTMFLWKKGLKDLVTEPLDYLSEFNFYLYKFVPGYFLQELSVKHKSRSFLNKIPLIVKGIKRIHNLKVGKRDKIARYDKNREKREWQRDSRLIKRYFSSIFEEVKSWEAKCRFLKNRYKEIFSPKFWRLTHGDFYSRNVLISGDTIKFIDFTDSVVYDPLNDISNFLINTELMFEYDFPVRWRQLMRRLRGMVLENYFSRSLTEEENLKINYFILKNLIRILFAVMREGYEKPISKPTILINKLMKFGREKYNDLLSCAPSLHKL